MLVFKFGLTFMWVATRYPSRKKRAVMSVPAVLATYMATASRKHFPAGQAWQLWSGGCGHNQQEAVPCRPGRAAVEWWLWPGL